MALANSTVEIATEQITFENNSVKNNSGGGGLYMEYQSQVRFSDQVKNLTFVGNTAVEGGGIYCIGSYYKLRSASFINNAATFGGAIFVAQGKASQQDTDFRGNSGSALYSSESNLTFSGNTRFYRNIGNATTGGGITLQQSNLSFEDATVFEGNYARFEGGAVVGAYKSTFSFSGNTSFINNTAALGGAIHTSLNTALVLSGTVLLKNNIAQYGRALFLAKDTSTTLKHDISFALNSAQNGGAIYLQSGGALTLESNTYLDVSYNHATMYGGGIYHEDSITPLQCDFSMKDSSKLQSVTLPNCFLKLRQ